MLRKSSPHLNGSNHSTSASLSTSPSLLTITATSSATTPTPLTTAATVTATTTTITTTKTTSTINKSQQKTKQVKTVSQNNETTAPPPTTTTASNTAQQKLLRDKPRPVSKTPTTTLSSTPTTSSTALQQANSHRLKFSQSQHQQQQQQQRQQQQHQQRQQQQQSTTFRQQQNQHHNPQNPLRQQPPRFCRHSSVKTFKKQPINLTPSNSSSSFSGSAGGGGPDFTNKLGKYSWDSSLLALSQSLKNICGNPQVTSSSTESSPSSRRFSKSVYHCPNSSATGTLTRLPPTPSSRHYTRQGCANNSVGSHRKDLTSNYYKSLDLTDKTVEIEAGKSEDLADNVFLNDSERVECRDGRTFELVALPSDFVNSIDTWKSEAKKEEESLKRDGQSDSVGDASADGINLTSNDIVVRSRSNTFNTPKKMMRRMNSTIIVFTPTRRVRFCDPTLKKVIIRHEETNQLLNFELTKLLQRRTDHNRPAPDKKNSPSNNDIGLSSILSTHRFFYKVSLKSVYFALEDIYVEQVNEKYLRVGILKDKINFNLDKGDNSDKIKSKPYSPILLEEVTLPAEIRNWTCFLSEDRRWLIVKEDSNFMELESMTTEKFSSPLQVGNNFMERFVQSPTNFYSNRNITFTLNYSDECSCKNVPILTSQGSSNQLNIYLKIPDEFQHRDLSIKRLDKILIINGSVMSSSSDTGKFVKIENSNQNGLNTDESNHNLKSNLKSKYNGKENNSREFNQIDCKNETNEIIKDGSTILPTFQVSISLPSNVLGRTLNAYLTKKNVLVVYGDVDSCKRRSSF